MIFDILSLQPPMKIALHDETRSILYGDMAKEIHIRTQLLEGVRALAIALDNGVDWVLWDLAALTLGIPCVPLPPFFTDEQVSHALQASGVSHVVTPYGMKDTGHPAADIPRGTAKITFTSGTTGQPKGVCLPWDAMQNVAEGVVGMLGPSFSGVHASVLPLGILLENIAGVYAALLSGASVHLSALSDFGPNYAHLHARLKKSGATSVILVPEILRLLMAQVRVHGPLPDLKFIAVGGAKIDPALIAHARAMNLPVYEGYGLSECASVVSLNVPGRDKPGSVGRLLPHVRADIADGEVVISNPGFLGYIGEAAPARFPTGDLGAMDQDGFLSITGRSKNVLITSYGRNVSPEWVEAALLAQPAIAQAIVYGDSEPYLGALIVPVSEGADIATAIQTANKTLPVYAQVLEHHCIPMMSAKNGMLTGNGRPRREAVFKNYAYIFKKEKTHEFL